MSLPTEVPLRCSCGHDFTSTIWKSVNTLDENLKQAFLNGTLNVVKCPKCQRSSFVPHPLLYNDLERRLHVWVYDGSLSKDPRREQDPKLASAITGSGIEILAADDFDCARMAIAALEDRAAFARVRAAHRDWPDSKVYARMFEQSFQAAKDRLNEPLVSSAQSDTGITDEDLDALTRQIAERAAAKHVAKRGSTSFDADAGTTNEEPTLEEVDALLAEWDEGDANEDEQRVDLVGRVIEQNPDASLLDIMDDCERRLIVDTLEKTHWNQTEAAEGFGVPLSMLQEKIKRLNIEAPRRSSAASGVGIGKDFASGERAALEKILAWPLGDSHPLGETAATGGESTLREAFWDSARQDAPAPLLWWVLPVGGIILGAVLFTWSPFVGAVVAGLSATLLLVGIDRAARNRPPEAKGTQVPATHSGPDRLWRRLVEWVIFLESGYLFSWLALSLIQWPRTPVHVDSLEGLVLLAVGGFLLVRAINYPRQRDLRTLVLLSATLGSVIVVLMFASPHLREIQPQAQTSEESVPVPLRSETDTNPSPETILTVLRITYGDDLGKSRDAILAKYGQPDKTAPLITRRGWESWDYEAKPATQGRRLWLTVGRGQVEMVTIFAEPTKDLDVMQVVERTAEFKLESDPKSLADGWSEIVQDPEYAKLTDERRSQLRQFYWSSRIPVEGDLIATNDRHEQFVWLIRDAQLRFCCVAFFTCRARAC